jgi:DNA-binding SARP family transcriptional activator
MGIVRFRILGTVEYWDGHNWAGINAPKWRSLLSALLISAGQVVPTDRLVTELWGDGAPAGATNLISIYALRLRRLIGDEHGQVLRTRSPGYQLCLEPEDLDTTQFDALVRQGRQALAEGKPQRAAELLARALDLWRGDAPLLDVASSPLVTAEAERLDEARLGALELRITADIACGRHEQVIAELSRLVAAHPLREGSWSLLMQALDRAGRHAEALSAYDRARRAISDELGVDPGEQLHRLFQQMLNEDQRPEDGEAAAAVPVAGLPEPNVPRQLPTDLTDFTGRTADVDKLCELRPGEGGAGAVVVALVTGAGGLGKTALAVHAAHELSEHFPEGQMYINLLGWAPHPLAPADVLARFLRELGVEDARIPVDEEERAGLYRTLLTERKVLILLDNARDAAQVRPLLPGSASCVVLVTSRTWLPGLIVPKVVDLGVLGEEEARELFASIVGQDRVDAEPDATGEVLAACAGLPLAIRIAGARLAARQAWTVRSMANKLSSERQRLDVLKTGDLAVRASFEVSFASLPAAESPDGIEPATAFRLLGLWTGPAIALPAAAALFGQPEPSAQDVLELLVDAHLVESPGPDSYRFHDLLRVYAAERCQQDEPEQARQDAVGRVLSWYLHSTEAAASVISPNRAPVPLSPADPGVQPLAFSGLEEALDWCDVERAGLVAATKEAAVRGLHDIAWKLPTSSVSYFYRRGHWADWIATHEIGLRSTRRLGDRLAEARVLNNLGMAYGAQNMPEAVDCLEQAVAIYRELGQSGAVARAASNNLVHTHLQSGRYQQALDAAQAALAEQQRAEDRYGQGVALQIIGGALRSLGRLDDAADHFRQALEIFRDLDDGAEADVLDDLGEVYLDTGQVKDAIRALRESLDIWYRIGDQRGQAQTLALLGRASRCEGKPEEARESLTQAKRIFEELGDHAQAKQMRAALAELPEAEH